MNAKKEQNKEGMCQVRGAGHEKEGKLKGLSFDILEIS
jgi:hypothetical protein